MMYSISNKVADSIALPDVKGCRTLFSQGFVELYQVNQLSS